MGKRDLILIAVFAAIGVIAWRLTSGPAEPGTGGQGLARAWRNIRAELSGERASLDIERKASAPLAPGQTLAIADVPGEVSVSGEERSDVAVELRATVRAADQAEVKALGDQVGLTLEPDGDLLRLRLTLPEAHSSSRLELRVLVPAGAAVKIAHRRYNLAVKQVKTVDLDLRRVDARLGEITGEVTGEQVDGEVEIVGAGGVSVNFRRVDARLDKIAGRVKSEVIEGQFLGRRLEGPVSLEAQRTGIELDEVAGAVTVAAADGRLEVRGARDTLKVDGKRANVLVWVDSLREIDVTSQDGDVEVTLGEAGAVVDLVSEEGRIRLPDESIAVTDAQSTRRASGTLGRGGTRIKVRTSDADIVIRR